MYEGRNAPRNTLAASRRAVLAAALFPLCLGTPCEGSAVRLVTREVSLGKVLPNVEVATASPDSKRAVSVAECDGKLVWVVDGKEGREYDAAPGTLIFILPGSRRGTMTRRMIGTVIAGLVWTTECAALAAAQVESFQATPRPAARSVAGLPVWDATFSPDGRRVLTVSANRTARVRDAATGKPLTPPLGHGADR